MDCSAIQISSDEITSTDGRKRVRMTMSNECFLDEILTVPYQTDPDTDVTVLEQTQVPPVLNVDDPFTTIGKTRIRERKFMIDSMFTTFNDMLYSSHPTSKFMTMVSFYRDPAILCAGI